MSDAPSTAPSNVAEMNCQEPAAPIAEQLQQAVTETRRRPKPMSLPTSEGWWFVNGELVWIDEDDLETWVPGDELYGPLPSEAPEPDATLADLTGTAADRLKRFVALEKERRELDTKLKDVKTRVDAMQKNLLEDFAEAHATSVKCDGLTVYLKKNRYVSKGKGISTEVICEKLEEIGWDDMVKDGYNASSLKARVLETLINRDEIAEQLKRYEANQQMAPYELIELQAKISRIEPLFALLNIGEVTKVQTLK